MSGKVVVKAVETKSKFDQIELMGATGDHQDARLKTSTKRKEDYKRKGNSQQTMYNKKHKAKQNLPIFCNIVKGIPFCFI